ncbi:phosphoglycerate kinase [Emcibacter sp. SYSU 3D8]|uniref:phosphoglycerate kinase n=1 Tax=Emcibacter sp. SYSU 3D8 TaxID=3133969 RepID=UPI0031FF103B
MADSGLKRFKTLDDLDVAGKTVLVRADLNVPMRDGEVGDDTRIRSVVPTLKAILARGGKVVVLSHFGRPKGKRLPEASLRPVAEPLSRALGRPVAFAEDCIGPEAKKVVKGHDVVLLENLRYHAGEEANGEAFASKLAELGDAYVNDGFSVSHRAHASVDAITRLLPSAAGLSMQAELEALEKALHNPDRPVAAIVGGSKVSSKLEVLGALVNTMDYLIIGGGMANTFLYAKGVDVGASLCEKDLKERALEILARARTTACKILLPIDAVVAQELAANVPVREVPVREVESDDMILDVGSDTIEELKHVLRRCKTLLWNGPLGAFEVRGFDVGTVALAREAARLTREGNLLSVAGGGDTVSALNNAGVSHDFSYISTAGGAFLEWVEGKELPGVKALQV